MGAPGGTVWRAVVPHTLFGAFNPFAEEVDGDWLVHAASGERKHLGDVYLNGRSFYEVTDVDAVSEPPVRTEASRRVDRACRAAPRRRPGAVRLARRRSVTSTTTIWANFQGADPNVELVEINVRRSVFYPTEHHLDYITVRGFEMAHAATPWSPPTADQPGLHRAQLGQGLDHRGQRHP